MKLFTRKVTPLEKEIERALGEMQNLDIGTDEYKKAAESVEKLLSGGSYKNENSVGAETIFSTVSAIVYMVIMMNHERLYVISTKALQFALKLPKII